MCILHQKLKEIATSGACAPLQRERTSGKGMKGLKERSVVVRRERNIRQVAWMGRGGATRRRIARTKIRIRCVRRGKDKTVSKEEDKDGFLKQKRWWKMDGQSLSNKDVAQAVRKDTNGDNKRQTNLKEERKRRGLGRTRTNCRGEDSGKHERGKTKDEGGRDEAIGWGRDARRIGERLTRTMLFSRASGSKRGRRFGGREKGGEDKTQTDSRD